MRTGLKDLPDAGKPVQSERAIEKDCRRQKLVSATGRTAASEAHCGHDWRSAAPRPTADADSKRELEAISHLWYKSGQAT